MVQQQNSPHELTILRVSETNFTYRLQIVVAQIIRSAFLNLGSLTLDTDKIATLFSQTYNLNSDFHSITNTDKAVIYYLQTPKVFVNFNKYHYLYFIH